MEWDVFIPNSPPNNTLVIQPASPAPLGVQAAGSSSGPIAQYRVANTGTVVAWITYGSTAAAARNNATIPAVGSIGSAWPVMPGTVEIFSAAPGQFWSGITSGPSTVVAITYGKGG